MKRSVIISCFSLTVLITRAQTWSTSLNTGTDLQLGTSTSLPLDFYTNGTKAMTLGTDGSLKLRSYDGTGSSLAYFDENGVLSRAAGSAGAGAPCVASAFPWSQGGNNNVAQNTIGTCDNVDFILKSNNSQSVFLKTNGYVGIGLNNGSPAAPFDLSDGTTSGNTDHLRFYPNSYGVIESTTDMNLFYKTGGGLFISQGSYTGTSTLKLALNSGGMSLYSNLGVSGRMQSSNSSDASQALSAYNSTNSKTNFLVLTSGKTQIGSQTGAANSAMLNVNMNSSSGGSAADNALDVFDQNSNNVNFRIKASGYVYAREIKVTTTNFPDYVFGPGYCLKPLKEVESYYLINKHLPEVPSESEVVKAGGIELGEMNKLLLKKVEELTVYLVAQNKLLEKHESEIAELKKQLNHTK